MVIVDTTVWIDYLGGITNGQTSWLDREMGRQRLGLTDLILCEVLQGVRGDVAFTQMRQDFRNSRYLIQVEPIWPWQRRATTGSCVGRVTPYARPSIA